MVAQIQGDNLALRDGFYGLPEDANQPASAQRITWAASTNGSFYYDDQFNLHRIPADQPIVIPNRRVLLNLGNSLFWFDQGQVTAAPPEVAQQIRSLYLTRALAQLQSGARPTLILGRESDFHVPGKSVSRKHAQITWDGQGFSIQDLKSTRGTRMHVHEQVQPLEVPDDRPIPLIAGARIRLGDVAITFNPPPPPASPV